MISDEVLMLAFQHGSREAFEELYARYRGPLFGFFRRRLASDGRAEDLAQETFLVVIRGVQRYEPRALVRTYIYAIAMKQLLSERRKQVRDGTDLASLPEMAMHESPDRMLWLRHALQKLDSMDREVLMLREYEQLSYEEIAEVLRLPINTVRSRLFRARLALKEQLQPDPQVRRAAVAESAIKTRAITPGEA